MLSDLAKDLRDILTTEPQTRAELCDELSCGDRSLRRAVNELRKHGYNIASNSDTRGYWYGDENDKERTIKDLRARAAELRQTAIALENGPDLGQMEVDL